MILNVIIVVLILLGMGVFCYLNYKRCKDDLEKSLYILLFFVSIIPISLYYLDRYNIPTLLGWSVNVNSQNWLSFLASYSSGVISAIIGAVVLVIVTIVQIKKNNEDSIKRDKENMRLQNMPTLKYSFDTVESGTGELDELIITDIEKGIPYKLNIYLKNIGLNNIKNLKVDFKSDIINNTTERLLGKNSIEVMEKGEEKVIRKIFSLKSSNIPYEMSIIIYYQDVLSNWYKQEVQVQYTATNIFEPGGYIGTVEFKVKEDEKIEVGKIKNNI